MACPVASLQYGKESSAMTAPGMLHQEAIPQSVTVRIITTATGAVRPMQPVEKDIKSEDAQHNSTADSTSLIMAVSKPPRVFSANET